MPMKPKRPCNKPGCRELTTSRFCEQHAKQYQQNQDRQRGTAHERGYTYRWRKYSKWFLKQPDNVFCKLQLKGCTNLAECVDHIDPDKDFWDKSNHQAACVHCNSVKGRRVMVGESEPFEANTKRVRVDRIMKGHVGKG